MDAALRQLLDELEAWGRDNDARQPDRRRKMLNLHPDTARLLGILVRAGRRTRLLEVGTSNGYSTLWLAWAARETGGRVVSIDANPDKHALADANLRRGGLRDLVELRTGDAADIIAALPGPFDFVFFDADRLSAPAQLTLLLPKLAPGALVAADNALSHPDEIAPYLDAVRARPEFDHLVVPVGKGLSLAYRAGPRRSRSSPCGRGCAKNAEFFCGSI
jgi:predicted O-methyltransferase YrrM